MRWLAISLYWMKLQVIFSSRCTSQHFCYLCVYVYMQFSQFGTKFFDFGTLSHLETMFHFRNIGPFNKIVLLQEPCPISGWNGTPSEYCPFSENLPHFRIIVQFQENCHISGILSHFRNLFRYQKPCPNSGALTCF